MSIICVTGGSGFIGKELVKRLSNTESSIRLLTRKNVPNTDRLEYYAGDLSDPKISLEAFLDGVDVIFHCAGEISDIAAMRALHVDGTSHLLSAVLAEIRRSKKSVHWVQLSSVGAYGPPQGRADEYRIIDEKSATHPNGEYEITKTLSDELVIKTAKITPLLSFTILRPSNVIGQTMTNQSLRALINAVKSRQFFYIGGKYPICNYIHVDDVVSALMLCGSDARANGEIFNLSNDCLLKDLIGSIELSFDLRSTKLCVPETPLRILVSIVSKFKKIPLTSDRIDALVKRTFYKSGHISRVLGFIPQHVIPEAVPQMFNLEGIASSRKKICIVATVPFALNIFMRPHIEMLSLQHDVTLIANCDVLEVSGLMGEHVNFVSLKVERKIFLWRDFQSLIALFKIFRNEKFDVVHSLMPKAGLLAMLSAAMAGVPIRIHIFTGQVWANKSGFSRNFLKVCDIIISRCSTNLLADSNSQKLFLAEQQISPLKKIKVLGEGSICGVDLNRFKPNLSIRLSLRAQLGIPRDEIVYLFIGRLNKDKGILDLAVAFKNLTNEDPNVHLLVVGPDEEGIYSRIAKMLFSCSAQLHCVGYSEKPEEYMACADILCLPSYREGFGSVVIEAAAVGLPAIVSDIYGLQDAVINYQTGILHQPKNIDEMTAAMRALGKNSRLRNKMAKLAKSRAEACFSTSTLVSEMRNYYISVLSGSYE